MPDQETATPRDGGWGDRTPDLLLAKAQHTVQQGDADGTAPGSHPGSAAAAATRHRTPTEPTSETRTAGTCIVCNGTGAAIGDYGDTAGAWCDACGGSGLDDAQSEETGACRVCGEPFTALDADVRHLCPTCDDRIWDILESHARSCDRSAAAHTLRVRADQVAGQQRHVRRAVHA